MSRASALASVIAFTTLVAVSQTLAQPVVRLPAADVALRVRPATLFTVGEEDGRDWEVFARINDVAFDGRGNLYVLDSGNDRVVVFDSTGRFVRAMGHQGGGPGEFTIPSRMTVTDAGEVIVSDLGRRAFSVFGPDGRFRRSVPFPNNTLFLGSRLVLHPRGGVVSLVTGNPVSGSPDARGDELVLWYPLDGARPAPLFVASTYASRTQGGASLRVRQEPVFSPWLNYALLSDGALVVANTVGYSVRVVDAAGRTTRVLERAISPRRVTERDRELELERRRSGMRGSSGYTIVGPQSGAIPAPLRPQVATALLNVEFATHMPVIQSIQVDRAGNLWIKRSGPGPDRQGPIDIVTPAGRYLGTLAGFRSPAAFGPGGRAAVVETDELGVQRVRVLRFPTRWS